FSLNQVYPLMPELLRPFDRSNRLAVYGDQIVLAKKDIQLAEFEAADRLHFGFIQNDEVISLIFVNLWSLMLVFAVFNGKRMKAELARQVVKVATRRIGNIHPEDVRIVGAVIGDARAILNL